jgi:diguanylate cyclase (GGDEF)-like protein/putative nucleotidyltransferase with HDIG domain
MPMRAKIFIALSAVLGISLFVLSLSHWQSNDRLHLAAFIVLALLASGLKVVLPGINTSMSPNFLFILLGVLELSQSETMLLGCASTAAQCFWKMNRPAKPVRVLFNVFSMMAPTVWVCTWVYRHSGDIFSHSVPLMVLATATSYFLANTLPIAMVISLSESRPFRETWSQCYFWSFPYYLAGAGLVVLVYYCNRWVGWQTSLLVMPIVYWIYRSYRLYLTHLEDEKRHVGEMAELHLRTIEALALAIDAKDHTTHEHLQRVRVYATEIGKELGLAPDDLEALKAASILHDIGKLAVPEHIISKPGKLTPEEFEKMKIHPVVGAEILRRVKFPYPVVPLVRHHHEKWDGTGYPDGLAREAIPIGARILSAVDCMDALASDRQYRRAMPLDDALNYVVSLAGKEFDPKVVEILRRRYLELEQLAIMAASNSSQDEPEPAFVKMPADTATGPAAGFEQDSTPKPVTADHDFLYSIAAARQEAQMLFELSHDLGNSLSLEDTLSVVSGRLRRLVPYDSIAIWIQENGVLIPKHVTGDDFRLFSSLEIPLGHGLSGWVVHNRKPILNGNPSVEPGYLNNPLKYTSLRAALSVPLEGLNGTVGALSLYRAETDSFNRDHLRILLAISPKIAMSIENALKYQQAQTSATTDYLTGLPNARSLFLQLDRELARCKRTGATLAVMVCDLNRFKSINDVFGHLEGNKVLHAFAQALRENSREYEYVARMGGDEFVIIVPGLTPEQAKYKSERINELAKQTAFAICGKNTLSAAVGTAFFLTDGTDAEHLLAQADRRMYMMKNVNRPATEEDASFAPPHSTLVQ